MSVIFCSFCCEYNLGTILLDTCFTKYFIIKHNALYVINTFTLPKDVYINKNIVIVCNSKI